jgi:hypothetical protein
MSGRRSVCTASHSPQESHQHPGAPPPAAGAAPPVRREYDRQEEAGDGGQKGAMHGSRPPRDVQD